MLPQFCVTFPKHPGRQYLTLLPTAPTSPDLALGHSTRDPPTVATFTENPYFRPYLHECLRQYAHRDPDVVAAAKAFASSAGAGLGNPAASRARGGGGASNQGGAGGGGTTGYVHVSDLRNPPAYGRIADPQDIFGSLAVDSEGNFVDGTGNYEESGTYRIWTPDGW